MSKSGTGSATTNKLHHEQMVIVRRMGRIAGAILIHPFVIALALLKGFLFGAARPLSFHGAAPHETGFPGAENSVSGLLFYYLISFGMIPLVISVIGNMVGYRIAVRYGSARPGLITECTDNQLSTATIAWITAVWACGLYIVAFLVTRTVAQLIALDGGGHLRWLLPFLPFTIWATGAVAAFFRHRSWQMSTALFIIACLLRVVVWRIGFPGYTPLLLAALFLTYAGATHFLKRFEARELATLTEVNERTLGTWMTFLLGGFGFYAMLCLYCLIWRLYLGRSSEDWGPVGVLILGGWGVPIFGCIAAIVQKWSGPWTWLATPVAWIAVCAELVVCLGVWLSMLKR